MLFVSYVRSVMNRENSTWHDIVQSVAEATYSPPHYTVCRTKHDILVHSKLCLILNENGKNNFKNYICSDFFLKQFLIKLTLRRRTS